MKNHKATKKDRGRSTEIDKRRMLTAEYYLAGHPQFAIVGLLKRQGISSSTFTVSKDLDFMQTLWEERGILAIEKRKVRELAAIDDIERMAHSAWKRSCKDHEEVHKRIELALRKVEEALDIGETTHKINGKKVKIKAPASEPKLVPVKVIDELRKSGRCGDPRFLERMSWCVEARCKITGILKQDNKTEVAVVNINWDEVFRPGPRPSEAIDAQIEAAALPPPVPEAP